MYIERVQVEEGFLGGLDVQFSPGLNVVIGARGTGKTSLIELIRFCLDVPGNTNEVTRRSKEHALSILGPGQVTVTLVSGGQRTVVSRTASDALPRSTGSFAKPIVFSQTEIETIGLEPQGRLRLVDSFMTTTSSDNAEEKRAIADIASLTAECLRVRKDIEELERALQEAPSVNSELAQNAELEANVAKASTVLQSKADQLKAISEILSAGVVKGANLERAKKEITDWYGAIKGAYEFALSDQETLGTEIPSLASENATTREILRQALQSSYNTHAKIDERLKAVNAERLLNEQTARGLRQEVDSHQAGAGQIMRKGQELRAKKATLDSIVGLCAERRNLLAALVQKRSEALGRLEQVRTGRHMSREIISDSLNDALRPNIRTSVLRNGQQSNFTSLISDLLRGSGVRYGDVAQALSARLSPRSLLEAVDDFDVDLVVDAVGISVERASRVLSHLRTLDLSSLATIDIEDEVTLQLLDGTDYKDIATLSTGQRCTVVLPLILAHRDKVLIVDQPEDHIDNAFIAGTLIKSLLMRDVGSQILFSTHNPNIPVLGNADRVIHLGSDGRQGFVLAAGALNDARIVEAISNVMEGGAAAFEKRASFYDSFSVV
ncbi:AAA family ATPase [Paraburkholderia sp. CNPSo 3155]|uniref:AAA family ATPase n=1 Tax=Paraburkholderia atlantica TaxID=2654982 RepID=UPI00128B2E77|nr:AAA family ATPase [Paraburkholderia atlantica]MPW11071.1 AAA family ATPase [Paraburkholderia atlantica]